VPKNTVHSVIPLPFGRFCAGAIGFRLFIKVLLAQPIDFVLDLFGITAGQLSTASCFLIEYDFFARGPMPEVLVEITQESFDVVHTPVSISFLLG
jgi:hypothetical protein